MVLHPAKPESKGGRKRYFVAIALIASALFILAGSAAPATAAHTTQAQAEVQNGYQPEPTMNSNITWNTFYNGWSPLEYNNGTANMTLNTQESSIYANPISINPTDIQGITGTYLPASNTSNWQRAGGTVAKTGQVIHLYNNSGRITLKTNGSNWGNSQIPYHLIIPITKLPSNNPQYDYITLIANMTGQTITGESQYLYLANATNAETYGNPAYKTAQIHGTGTTFQSLSLAMLKNTSKYGNFGPSDNSLIKLGMVIIMPNGTGADTFGITLDALFISETPIYLGSNSTTAEVVNGTGNIRLTNFSPNFAWTDIRNNGYTVATSQLMQNPTIQHVSINNGIYTQQATYQGQFQLPTAPDLTYGTANISVPLTISGKQYEVATLNGASYLPQIQNRTNGTFTFATVNANNPNTLILEVQFTTQQWDASSGAPSFFSIAGLEYYWWVGLIGLFCSIGLGSFALSHFSGDEEGLRIPKGKFGR